MAYNIKNNITPTQIFKSKQSILDQTSMADVLSSNPKAYIEKTDINVAADPVVRYMSKEQLQKNIQKTRKAIENAVKELDFIRAAQLRDELYQLQNMAK